MSFQLPKAGRLVSNELHSCSYPRTLFYLFDLYPCVPPQPRPHDTQARFAIFDPRENRRRRPVCCSRLRQADLESGQDERDKRQDLSFGDEASGAIRRASAKRPEVGAPHQILLLQEMLGVERFRVGAESSIVEMELTGGNQHFGALAQAFPAKGERTDERSGSWMTMR